MKKNSGVAQIRDEKARRRNRTGNLLITNEVLSQVELGGRGG
jgi:ribonuclease D